MYTQMTLFEPTQMPKQTIRVVKDKHPERAKTTLYSLDWCFECNKFVAMVWIEHGIKKRCTCGKEYDGWKCLPETKDQPGTNTL